MVKYVYPKLRMPNLVRQKSYLTGSDGIISEKARVIVWAFLREVEAEEVMCKRLAMWFM